MDFTVPDPSLYNVPFTTDSFNGMPYRVLGNSGLRVSHVGLGTWKMGFPETGDGARVGEKEAFRILDRAVELGVTFWDTANRYNNASGNSERIIGRWLQAHPEQRRNVVIATKIFGGMDGRTPNHSRLSRANILDAVYACLRRLQVDYIDFLYFHRWDGETPVEESLAAIYDLVQRDLIRYFGVSNFTADQLAVYRAAAAQFGVRCQVQAVQNNYDVLRGESQPGVLDYAAAQRISFVAWSPLALGLLTDRYLDLSKVGPGDRLYDEGVLQKYTGERTMGRLRRLAELAQAYGHSLSQLTLAYMLTMPGMGPVIPSSTSVAQLEMNAEAGRIKLEEPLIAQVKQVLAE